jgi:hypothetical protein
VAFLRWISRRPTRQDGTFSISKTEHFVDLAKEVGPGEIYATICIYCMIIGEEIYAEHIK